VDDKSGDIPDIPQYKAPPIPVGGCHGPISPSVLRRWYLPR